eukprot:44807_1
MALVWTLLIFCTKAQLQQTYTKQDILNMPHLDLTIMTVDLETATIDIIAEAVKPGKYAEYYPDIDWDTHDGTANPQFIQEGNATEITQQDDEQNIEYHCNLLSSRVMVMVAQVVEEGGNQLFSSLVDVPSQTFFSGDDVVNQMAEQSLFQRPRGDGDLVALIMETGNYALFQQIGDGEAKKFLKSTHWIHLHIPNGIRNYAAFRYQNFRGEVGYFKKIVLIGFSESVNASSGESTVHWVRSPVLRYVNLFPRIVVVRMVMFIIILVIFIIIGCCCCFKKEGIEVYEIQKMSTTASHV